MPNALQRLKKGRCESLKPVMVTEIDGGGLRRMFRGRRSEVSPAAIYYSLLDEGYGAHPVRNQGSPKWE